MSLMNRKGDWYCADTARVIGDVRVGAGSSIWFGCVLRGDDAPITLGRDVNVQDGSILHADPGVPMTLGDRVSVGHGAVVHCVEVGEGTLIGIGAIVLGGARIGRDCLIAASALVPEGMEVPDHSVVMGVPGRIRRQVTPEEAQVSRIRAANYREKARKWHEGHWKNAAE
ncbi:MAG: gamma carbonic anhydrase family protein [Planctomycetes bacterium]|nr:gamma carbonic anhydrase family protein [Planctomycetota bacterium]